MADSFLPKDYEIPKTKGKYMKLQQGENKFRVLSKKGIVGYEYWNQDNKPVRSEKMWTSKPEGIRLKEGHTDWHGSVKHFWAFAVWDYADGSVKILQLTQGTIQDPMMSLYKNEDWGHFNGYDISITREGEKLETKYTVMPNPHKPMTQDQELALNVTPVNLKALYDGADPFAVEEKEGKITVADLPF